MSHRGTFCGSFGIKGLRGRVRGILTIGGLSLQKIRQVS